jgi:hypothetical protein
VLNSYLLNKADLRSASKVGRDLKRELKPSFNRSIDDIDENDIEDLIALIKIRGKSQARYIYTLLKGFFSWAVKSRRLSASPCAPLDTKILVGEPV